MSRGGIVVALVGAHAAAAKPVVEALLEEHEIDDPRAPCVRVYFDARELLQAPAGARVVLLNAARDAVWLNLNRPVVKERSLAVFLWMRQEELNRLREQAQDFADWVSHRVDIPPSGRAIDELRRAITQHPMIAVRGFDPAVVFDEPPYELSSGEPFAKLVDTMAKGPVIVSGVYIRQHLFVLVLAQARANERDRRHHPVILRDPLVILLDIPEVDGQTEQWQSAAVSRRGGDSQRSRLQVAIDGLDQKLEDNFSAGLEHVRLTPEFLSLTTKLNSDDLDFHAVYIALKFGVIETVEAWLADWLDSRPDITYDFLIYVLATTKNVIEEESVLPSDIRFHDAMIAVLDRLAQDEDIAQISATPSLYLHSSNTRDFIRSCLHELAHEREHTV